MKTRRLGRTGLRVSEIGFGAWGLGATMWRGVSDEEGVAAMRAALDAGVDFFDTAMAYGDGHSERLIAKTVPRSVVVATKIPPKDGIWPATPDMQIGDNFPRGWIRHCTGQSLEYLERDAIDLQQFHVWHDAWLDQPHWKAIREEMERMKSDGVVKHWGISINAHAPETALRALADPIFEVAQVIYNIFDRSPEKELFALARERNLGIIARVPFDEGALTGAIGPDTTFPEDDWRHRYFQGDRKAQAAQRADALRELLGDEAKTLPELALRFILSRPEVSTVIPGMRRAAHARANAAVSDGRVLSAGMLERLAAHAWDKDWH